MQNIPLSLKASAPVMDTKFGVELAMTKVLKIFRNEINKTNQSEFY